MYVSKKVAFWIIVSSIIVCFDAFFVLNRPETLRGGKYYSIYFPYELYYKLDPLYDMNDDKFVVIQSWLNYVQAFFALVTLAISFSSCRIKQLVGALLLMVVSTMTFWKTVIYLWYDSYWVIEDVHNFTLESLYGYIIPSSFWIVCPFLTVYSIMCKIVAEQKKKEKLD